MISRVEKEYNEIVERLKKDGTNLVDNSVWKYRLGICKDCEKYEEYNNGPAFRCNACGCPGFKFMLRGSICPHKKPKWR